MPSFSTEFKKAFTFDYGDRGWELNTIKSGLLGLALVAAIAGAVVASLTFGIAPIIAAAAAGGGFLGVNAIMHTGSMIYNRVKHGSIVPTKDHGVVKDEKDQSSRLATFIGGYIPLAPLFAAYDFRGKEGYTKEVPSLEK